MIQFRSKFVKCNINLINVFKHCPFEVLPMYFCRQAVMSTLIEPLRSLRLKLCGTVTMRRRVAYHQAYLSRQIILRKKSKSHLVITLPYVWRLWFHIAWMHSKAKWPDAIAIALLYKFLFPTNIMTLNCHVFLVTFCITTKIEL